MNPMETTSRTARRQGLLTFPACPNCGDFGFTAPGRYRTGNEIFDYGVACHCPHGARFAEQQMEWHLPILPRTDAPAPQRPRPRPAGKWNIPAELAALFQDKKLPEPAKPIPAETITPITQADIDAEIAKRKSPETKGEQA